jgi:hypothetical protein
MSILVKSKSKLRRAYVPTTALAKAVEFDDDMMHVFLTDGRIISVPIIWSPLKISAAALGGTW